MEWTGVARSNNDSARIDLSNELLYGQTEIVCQSYDPGKLMYQFTPNGAHSLAFHLLGLGFGMLTVFPLFLNNK